VLNLKVNNLSTILKTYVMRKMQIFSLFFCLGISNWAISQNWSLTGNPGTNQTSNFLGTTDNQQVVFRTNNTVRMNIGTNAAPTNQGAVTIGNLDPDAAPYYGGLLRLRSPNNETAIDLIKGSNNTGGWDNQIRFYNTNALRHVIADDYTTGKLLIQTNVDPSSGSVNFLDIRGKVQITRDGSITLTTPGDYDLYVAEGILTEKVKVAVRNTGDWSDYVFQKDYKLPSLTQLGKFIEQNKHLPGVPSSEEMVKNGNDLGKTDAKLLEKIEELTLYIIQLNQQLEEQKKEIAEIRKKQN
jgi:hypothetical protein